VTTLNRVTVPQQKDKLRLVDVRHPYYTSSVMNWRKWRLTYEGGDRFIHQYLKRFSKREDNQDFTDRYAVTYCPAFAKSAINEVKNAIFQRTVDVSRTGGSPAYQRAVSGLDAGVDLLGATMNSFVGRRLLPELLSMGRVGVYVDMPALQGPTKLDAKGKVPYCYWYPAEDILSWTMDSGETPNDFTEVLLADTIVQSNGDEFFLPHNLVQRYRHVWKDADTGNIWIQFYDKNGESSGQYDWDENTDPIELSIKRIPFVLLELSDSLLMDVANYQIALLNLASSDMAYVLKSNFPFYVEQFDPRTQSPYVKKEGGNVRALASTNQTVDPITQNATIMTTPDKAQEIKVGVASGRKYPTGQNQPAFIHPSSEPILASMEKQAQLKREIRELITLAISNLSPKQGSPKGSEEADTGLEAGLSYIGLELEHAERMIAQFWAAYEGSTAATISYPESYDLKTDEDRRREAEDLEKLMSKVPSKTYQKAIAKRMARTLLGSKVSAEEMAKIYAEIDEAVVVTTDPAIVQSDFEAGFVGLETASQIRGYPPGEVVKAKADHAERVATIAIAQSRAGGMGKTADLQNPQARGVPDASANPKEGSQERAASRDTTLSATTADNTRGPGRNGPASD
jgi:hypothetical protein